MIAKDSRAALPSCPPELLWDQFAALLLTRLEFAAGHPLGCHCRRINRPDRVRTRGARAGPRLGLRAPVQSRMFRPHHPPTAQGLSSARPSKRPSDRWAPVRGYEGQPRPGLGQQQVPLSAGELGFAGEIARKGVPAPIQAGKRWTVERTHSWMNGYGKLRRCTERNGAVVEFSPTLPRLSAGSACSSDARGAATAGTAAPPPTPQVIHLPVGLNRVRESRTG